MNININNERFFLENKKNINLFNEIKNNLFKENNYINNYNWNNDNITSTKNFIKNIDLKDISDDFYLNKIDFYENNIVFAINNDIHLFNNNYFTKILSVNNSVYPSCTMINKNDVLIGLSDGNINYYNLENNEINNINTLHSDRITIIKKNPISNIICSGSKDRHIGLYDYRYYKLGMQIKAHDGEICGMDWSENGLFLATGSNDNNFKIFDIRKFNEPFFQFKYKAAVRAIKFNPIDYNIIATGSGLDDKRMIIFNLKKNDKNIIQTDSQICNLVWNNNGNQIATSHGYPHNKIKIWNKVKDKFFLSKELIGHKKRVLYLSKFYNDDVLVSISSDQTLKFWRGFENKNLNFLR